MTPTSLKDTLTPFVEDLKVMKSREAELAVERLQESVFWHNLAVEVDKKKETKDDLQKN